MWKALQHWRAHAAVLAISLAAFVSGLIFLMLTEPAFPAVVSVAAWGLNAIAASIATHTAWKDRAPIALATQREEGPSGFRVSAATKAVHRFALGPGPEGRLRLAAAHYLVFIGLGLAFPLSFVIGPGAFMLTVLGVAFGPFVIPILAYVVLQHRRSIEVTRERVVVRDWMGFPRRLLLNDDVQVVLRVVVPSTPSHTVYAVEVHSAGKRVHIARIVGPDANALDEYLRKAIAQVRGLFELASPPVAPTAGTAVPQSLRRGLRS